LNENLQVPVGNDLELKKNLLSQVEIELFMNIHNKELILGDETTLKINYLFT